MTKKSSSFEKRHIMVKGPITINKQAPQIIFLQEMKEIQLISSYLKNYGVRVILRLNGQWPQDHWVVLSQCGKMTFLNYELPQYLGGTLDCKAVSKLLMYLVFLLMSILLILPLVDWNFGLRL